MSGVLLIQNTRIEGSGYLGELLESDGFKIHPVYAKKESIPEDDYSLLVVLGAPESANDDLPYLRAEEDVIRNFVSKNKPVLGICLGSQLIARTFGGQVYSGPKKEIGFYNDLKLADDSIFFKGFENPFTVFHWHGDTFDLPKGSTRLAYSKDYQNQAFQYKTAIGLQFHLEVNKEMVNLWLDKTQEKISEIPYIDPDEIRQKIETEMPKVNENMSKFYQNFRTAFNL
jgi:GMP synthase (glutamine-hydrolysing)